MGTPDDTATRACRTGAGSVPAKLYRWGGLHVTVVQAQPDGEYGFSYPAGAISGWRISSDAAPTFTGPKGTTIGTRLSTLRERFTEKDWDTVTYERGRFSVFAGDTTNAVWTIGTGERVVQMSAGLTC